MPLPKPSTPVSKPIVYQATKMPLWKKALLTLVILVVLSGAVFVKLPYILNLLYPNDAVLIDNSDVTAKDITVEDDKNGFYDLGQITEDMIKLPKGQENFDTLYTDYIQPVTWDQAAVTSVLSSNKQVLDLFTAASQKPSFQVPELANKDTWDLNTPSPLYTAWKRAARLKAIHALSLSYQGKNNEALREASDIAWVGHTILAGNANLVESLVGMLIQKIGYETMLEILPYVEDTSEVLASVAQDVEASSNNTEGYKNVFRIEYMGVEKTIDSIPRNLEESTKDLVAKDPRYAKYIKSNYYFKPNQTKNLFSAHYRRLVSEVGNRCDFSNPEQEQPSVTSAYQLMFKENAVGELLYTITFVSLGAVARKDCENDLLANIVKTQLALKAYNNKTWDLPDTLDALVPDYISSVPLDPFSKMPLRYSVEKKVLYSVGADLTDQGGSTTTNQNWQTMPDPTFEINF